MLRLCVGILILLHGINKLIHPESFDWLGQPLAELGLPSFIAYGVLLEEVVGPLMAGNMIVAVILVHLGQFWSLNDQGGWMLELQGMYFFGAVAILFLGSGRMALRPD
nr:DoxX family membrane protein [Salinicola peritrichatus]